jgi:hypothetical protein
MKLVNGLLIVFAVMSIQFSSTSALALDDLCDVIQRQVDENGYMVEICEASVENLDSTSCKQLSQNLSKLMDVSKTWCE